MAYGTLMRRAWQLVWSNKFLIVIAASPAMISLIGAGLNSVTGILGSILIIAASILSQTCLITAVLQLIQTGQSGYRLAWDVAWPLKWRVAGIELLAGLPTGLLGGVIGGVLGVVWAFVIVIALAGVQLDPSLMAAGLGIGAAATIVLCGLLIILSLPFTVWGRGAVITCLQEHTDVTDSLSRAWNVLRVNMLEAVTLALVQIAASLCINLIVALPLLALFLCPLAWPITWLVGGSLSAWWATVWTLAWFEWAPLATNLQPVRT